jgi:hypothetical protein
MKLSIITATAAVLLSPTSAWVLHLYEMTHYHGRSLTWNGTDSNGISVCVDSTYKKGEDIKTMDVKSLAFGADMKYGGLECCMWVHRNEKCAAPPGKSDAYRFQCEGFIQIPGIEHWMGWKLKSFQVSCHPLKRAPIQPPQFKQNIGRFNPRPRFKENCAAPSKCSPWWSSWLPGDDCTEYCYSRKGYLFNYMRAEGCNDGVLNLKKQCCCSGTLIPRLEA